MQQPQAQNPQAFDAFNQVAAPAFGQANDDGFGDFGEFEAATPVTNQPADDGFGEFGTFEAAPPMSVP